MNPKLVFEGIITDLGRAVLDASTTAGRLAAVQVFMRRSDSYSAKEAAQAIDEFVKVYSSKPAMALIPIKPPVKIAYKMADVVESPTFVELVQSLTKTTYKEASPPQSFSGSPLKHVLHIMKDFPDSMIIESLGEFGKTLLQFRSHVDIDHPTIANVQSGTLMEGGKVFKRVRETLLHAQFAKGKCLNEMIKVMCEWMNRNHNRITKTLLKPPARLLLDDSQRERSRDIGKTSNIDITRSKDRWAEVPDNFLPYVRLGPGFKEQIKYCKRMMQQCESMGLQNQIEKLAKDIDKYNKIVNDSYYGFVSISTLDAALILARSMGAKNNNNRISIPASIFTKSFWGSKSGQKTQPRLDTDPCLSEVYDRTILIETTHKVPADSQMFVYAPRLYPLSRFPVAQPDFVSELIKGLDHHVDIKGKALFDQFWVLVPGVYGTAINDIFEFYDGTKSVRTQDYNEYTALLDAYLVSEGQIFPIILGENTTEKKNYFIGYWTK